MDVESLAKQLILQNMTPEQQKAVLDSVRATLLDARGKQKQRVSENVGMVVDALKKIEADIRAKYDDLGNKITTRVNSIRDGRDGANGSDGRDGLDGRPGRDGAQGPAGPAGRDGVNGIDGVDGVSVIDAKIDFDGSLIISLSNGREINVGEVVAADVAEKIRVLTYGGSNGGGGGGTSGLTYKGTWNASTNTPTLIASSGTNGDYYIVSVAGTTDLNGITDWQPGDWVIFNGTVWQKIDQSWATAGVNNNITSMTGITGGISSPDFIQFDTTATVTDATGRLYYDDSDMYQTLAFQMNGSVIQHVGEEIFYRVRLSAAATKGQVLMFTGTLGASGGLTAAPATGLTFDQSNYLLGIAGESGSTNDWITVYEFGEVKGVNTSAFTQGQILYYDPTVAGGLTATKPNTPNAIATIAAVVHVGTSNGVLFVRPTFGSALGGTDGNVRFGTLASGNTVIYDAVDGVWKNANLTDGTGISITEGAGSITITNSAPDQTVALTGAGTTSISGTYPNFTVTSNDQYVGTVTSVGGTGTVNGLSLSGTVTSSGNLTLGGTLTGTASININGTVGATTPNTGAFTTLSATGVTTVQAGTAAAPAITTSGDTNTGIFFPAADTIAFSYGGVESIRIDASGRLLLGTTTAAGITYGITPAFQNIGVGENTSSSSNVLWSTTASSEAHLVIAKMKAATVGGTPAALVEGDNIGRIAFIASNGVTNTALEGAYIFVEAQGTFTSTAAPTRMSIATGSSTGTATPRIVLDSLGNCQFNSGYGSVATAYGCRAWVNFDATSNTANLSGTYSRTSPSTTLTVTATAHGLITGNAVYLDFTSGTAVDGVYTATVTSVNTFTVTTVASTTTSGNVTIVRKAIRASGNVSSIADNGTADYTVNFAVAMPDVNYAVSGMSQLTAGLTNASVVVTESQATTNVRLNIEDVDAGGVEPPAVFMTIHR
ncbi:Collagen triple helix repeat [uncultured Caudovirales phage]|uniref:Collagen triple helix repeat n=1 Tax=uncultured Caudovirales phage TaxID=2100421 RepID=A0A6J5NPV1_9CAUD|nr:Collagen triple helix repeat [uncultured Caudovirales phage]